MNKRLLMLFTVICLLFNSCVVIAEQPDSTQPEQSESTTTSYVQTNTSAAIMPMETSTPTLVPTIELLVERSPIDSAMVKDVKPAVPLKLDENGNISGLSPNVSQTWTDNLKAFYNAIIKKYPTSEIYLDVDTVSNSFAIVILMGGTVFCQTFKDQAGNYVYSNFPSSFEDVDNVFELSGDYKPIKVPNTSIGVIWTDGIPQLLANYVELPNGETYFTHYMDYSGFWDFNAYPWKEVTGVNEIMLSFPAVELDLEPIYVQETEYEYMGVLIRASLIVDDSVSGSFSQIVIPDPVYAEFVARVMFSVWWVKGSDKHTNFPDEEDFVNFMGMWSRAQKSGDLLDWEKVQINNVWMNDLKDGLGYKQLPYNIWPMYEGEAPEGVNPINKYSISFVCGEKDDFVTKHAKGTFWAGNGTNKDGMVMYSYQYYEDYSLFRNVLAIVNAYLASIDWWLKSNMGTETMAVPMNNGILDHLLTYGGTQIK